MLDDAHDLVALRTPANKDLLSLFLQNYWPFPVRSFPCVEDAALTDGPGTKSTRWPRKYWPLPREARRLGCSNCQHRHRSNTTYWRNRRAFYCTESHFAFDYDKLLHGAVCRQRWVTNKCSKSRNLWIYSGVRRCPCCIRVQ